MSTTPLIEGNMLVRFSSIETGSLTMFGDTAVQLIKMLGASGAMPGAISAEEIPAGVTRLRKGLLTHTASQSNAAGTAKEDNGEADAEPQVALATRAAPLIDLLTRAAAANVAVMWEGV